MSKLVLVEEISTFRIRYVVELADDEPNDYALDTVVMGDNDLREFSQKHLFAIPSSAREIGRAEYLRVFNEDNDYLKEWTDEQKFNMINRDKPRDV